MLEQTNYNEQPIFDVSSAVAVLNQTLEYSYSSIVVVGEVSQLRIAKDKWVYFDIKDAASKLKCFGTVFQLRMPITEGMTVAIEAQPRLHNQFGFSLNVRSIRPVGEGSIKKAADLLRATLEKEGLFAYERKRQVPLAPERVGLIASGESAAYADFIKIMRARWDMGDIEHYEVHVQGEQASADICSAIQFFNQQADPVDVLVLIRGGGSADDLAAFSTEAVTRAVAASRIPTVVAIGHEIDTSLAELAADLSASTPSNAAELLYPDKQDVAKKLALQSREITQLVSSTLQQFTYQVEQRGVYLQQTVLDHIARKKLELQHATSLLASAHPDSTLRRGFALITRGGSLISSRQVLKSKDAIQITFHDGSVSASVDDILLRK